MNTSKLLSLAILVTATFFVPDYALADDLALLALDTKPIVLAQADLALDLALSEEKQIVLADNSALAVDVAPEAVLAESTTTTTKTTVKTNMDPKTEAMIKQLKAENKKLMEENAKLKSQITNMKAQQKKAY